MVNKALYIGFNIYDKNVSLVINYQSHKYKIVVLFKPIDVSDFNILFICFLKYCI